MEDVLKNILYLVLYFIIKVYIKLYDIVNIFSEIKLILINLKYERIISGIMYFYF